MTRQIGSLLAELSSLQPDRSTTQTLEVQARHVFAAYQRLVEQIDKECLEEEATDLKKRLANACKTNDYRKFDRGLKKLDER